MDRSDAQPKTPTLKQVLEGAKLAQQRVAAWPAWKRELSVPSVQGRGVAGQAPKRAERSDP